MSELGLAQRVEIAAELGYDVIDSLTAELAQYDKIYLKLGRRAVGKETRSVVAASAWVYRDLLERDHEPPQVVREVERDSIDSTMTDFAILTSNNYLRSLFGEGVRQHRPYNKEVFPWPDGTTRCALTYAEIIWAPTYAAEFAKAHMLGLTSEVTLALAQPTNGDAGVGV